MYPISGDLEYLQPILNFAILGVCVVPLGAYMAKIYQGEATSLTPVLAWLESAVYKVSGVAPEKGMDWKTYALAALTFSALSFAALYLLLVFQAAFSANDGQFSNLSPAAAFNMAASFVANTHPLMPSSGRGISPFNQMAGLTVQTFLSAGVGVSVFIAITRGLAGNTGGTIGNFWVDLVRTILYLLVPVSLIFAALLATAGAVEALDGYAQSHLTDLAGKAPVIHDEAKRLILTDSGSLMNATSGRVGDKTHFAAGLVAFLSTFLIPAALCCTFGLMLRDIRQGLVSLIAMALATALMDRFAAKLIGADAGALYYMVACLVLSAAAVKWALGRQPSYLGRRLGGFEIAMAAIALSVPWTIIWAEVALSGASNNAQIVGSPLLFTVVSLTGLCLRFWVMIPALAIAGAFSSRKIGEMQT